ncbi:MAG: hypothetical protein COV41_01950 [Candidatus Brennerbacteria bacterium CG11_big_fil_rev_8_21_14_0_20_43_10]|uniref:Uncharacterized protein n=1 Tax=Candidatus Brennerbacteria bacterium CG11_big_fil_rev_8_21_14_0_20_43_10 TaxID=1974523 RepID=A0A2H0PWW9_9BACT|nr:MAG: hypothetical protein COV41_01950 [Candidatus Brennerbacteria bacterium CG11_big_fil_rev_8_21_14_0_20_43_10]
MYVMMVATIKSLMLAQPMLMAMPVNPGHRQMILNIPVQKNIFYSLPVIPIIKAKPQNIA